MTQEHPITPPPELIVKWAGSMCGYYEAARWGADQELDACCEWLSVPCPSYGRELRNARRPKPPSLKEQALTQLDSLHADLKTHGLGTNTDTIRRALEQLND